MTALFHPIIPGNPLHPLMQRIMWELAYESVEAVINSRLVGLDTKNEAKKLVKKCQIFFGSKLWELYLSKAFNDIELDIDYGFDAADFYLVHPNGSGINVVVVKVIIHRQIFISLVVLRKWLQNNTKLG